MGANNSGRTCAYNEWPSSRPLHLTHVHPRPHEVSDLCTLGFTQVKASSLVKVYDLFLSRTINTGHAI